MNRHGQDTSENGQILIIVLLVMVIGLATGLFLLGRTTTDISVSNRLEDSARAFNAAEVGIEETIYSGVSGAALPLPSGLGYTVSLANLTAASGVLFPGIASSLKQTDVGSVFTIWLIPHNDATGALDEAGQAYTNSTLVLCFTNAAPVKPAIGVTAYYKDVTNNKYRTSFVGFDPDSTRNVSGAGGGNKFLAVDATASPCDGANGYTYKVTLNLNGGAGSSFGDDLISAARIPLALRFRAFYAPTKIAVIPQGNGLPKQGNTISSTGTSGGTSRQINVNEHYIVPAPFLDHAVFNTGSGDFTK
jgi:hypothetical protein